MEGKVYLIHTWPEYKGRNSYKEMQICIEVDGHKVHLGRMQYVNPDGTLGNIFHEKPCACTQSCDFLISVLGQPDPHTVKLTPEEEKMVRDFVENYFNC